ncbi:hypothetical protein K523DRAFT_135782 [Schizophyllum commune Tattone D]|nr:hypothetical protein K523DRAFT_135782 [Schizophyllum commune Tattone D]
MACHTSRPLHVNRIWTVHTLLDSLCIRLFLHGIIYSLSTSIAPLSNPHALHPSIVPSSSLHLSSPSSPTPFPHSHSHSPHRHRLLFLFYLHVIMLIFRTITLTSTVLADAPTDCLRHLPSYISS